jgi:predicted DsbA family dithiol-disulfide isomerase
MTTAPAPIFIDVYSDVVCPWCFIGKHRLDAALAHLLATQPGMAARIRWLPYFLNPDTPPEGEPYRAFLEAKFGGADVVDKMQGRLALEGETSGVHFAFDKMKLRANTLHAHRLLHHVQQSKDGGPLKERLMSGYFERGEDVGDIDTLVRLAVECGEDEALTRAYLNSEQDVETVRGLAERARQMGVSGVPLFIFNQAVALNGAHPPQDILAAIEQARGYEPASTQ